MTVIKRVKRVCLTRFKIDPKPVVKTYEIRSDLRFDFESDLRFETYFFGSRESMCFGNCDNTTNYFNYVYFNGYKLIKLDNFFTFTVYRFGL